MGILEFMDIKNTLEKLLLPYKVLIRGIVSDQDLMSNSDCKSVVLIGNIVGYQGMP